MANLGNPRDTIEILQKYQFAFQKRFGQNFLIDAHVLEKIIRAAGVTKEDFVLEIGPGIGTMTQYLAEAAGKVWAVEIDRNLIPILKETLAPYDNVTVVNEDILKVDVERLAREENGGRPIKVVANLPYYITTPIIMGLSRAMCPLTASLSWCRRRWRTGCAPAPEARTTEPCPWRFSTMRRLTSRPTCRPTALCPGPRWARRDPPHPP